MKKRAIAWLIVLAVCLSAVPALAANVFQFTEKVISPCSATGIARVTSER